MHRRALAWLEPEIPLASGVQEWSLSVKPGSKARKAAETTLHPRRLRMVPEPR
jgi:pentalenene oxygenase